MNFINSLLTWIRGSKMSNPSGGKIRRDELEALGDLAEYVGSGLTEVVQSTTPGDRRNLFKNGNPDPRNVLSKALGRDLHNTRSNPPPPPGMIRPPPPPAPPVPNQPTQKVDINIPMNALPLTNEQLAALMQETGMNNEMDEINEEPPVIQPGVVPPLSLTPRVRYHNTPKQPEPIEQMEFNFVQQIIHPFGSVGDVINHFDSRLDKIEQSIKLINTFMVETRETMKYVKDNMQRKRKLSQSTGPL